MDNTTDLRTLLRQGCDVVLTAQQCQRLLTLVDSLEERLDRALERERRVSQELDRLHTRLYLVTRDIYPRVDDNKSRKRLDTNHQR